MDGTNKNSTTILLVDDYDKLRSATEKFLSSKGHVVVACGDAHTASRAFHSYTVDLLITDLELPGRSGIELARELTLVEPSLPVLIISGSIVSEKVKSEMKSRNWKFLGKPYSLSRLATALGDLSKMQRVTPHGERQLPIDFC